MEFNDLLELLEIDSPKDLCFFEQYAELAENETEIPVDTLSALLDEVDRDNLIELTESYFEDLMKYIPDDQTDFYTVLYTIGKAFTGLATALEVEGNRQVYAEEFFKFRNWFIFDSEVSCTNVEGGNESRLPVMKALALYRSEHLTDEEYTYDFSECLDYPIDEYIMPLNSFGGEEEDPADRYDDEEED